MNYVVSLTFGTAYKAEIYNINPVLHKILNPVLLLFNLIK